MRVRAIHSKCEYEKWNHVNEQSSVGFRFGWIHAEILIITQYATTRLKSMRKYIYIYILFIFKFNYALVQMSTRQKFVPVSKQEYRNERKHRRKTIKIIMQNWMIYQLGVSQSRTQERTHSNMQTKSVFHSTARKDNENQPTILTE